MKTFISALIIVWCWVSMLSANVIRVPLDQPTIQSGINAAVKGDTVLVAAGTYFENINFKGKAITVASHFLIGGDTSNINNTIINGSRPSDPNKGSVISFTSGEDTTSVICGFTITGGTGTIADAENRGGGGIYCYSSGARIVHNKIISNSVNNLNAARGGGIGSFPYGNDKYAIIENNIIELNTCIGKQRGQGGGIYLPHGRINNNLIRGNSCHGDFRGGGGGIHSASTEGVPRNLYVSGNTVVNNRASDSDDYAGGGGIDFWYGNLQLIGNTISHNLIDGPSILQGGGVRIYYVKDSAIVKGNTISFNSFINGRCRGGGMQVSTCNGLFIQGNHFEGNKASCAGGLRTGHIPGGVVSDNEFVNNFATDEGGAIADYDSKQLIIINNQIMQNEATHWGGAISIWDADVLIANNIINGNKSQWAGGILIYLYDLTKTFTVQIINNTITENVADSAGAIGIWRFKKVVSMNNICWGNNAPIGPEFLVKGGELNIAHSDIKGGAANIATEENGTVNWLAGNIDANPLFAFSNYQLSNSSPCIGAGIEGIQIGGTAYYCPDTDFEGNPRPDPAESIPDIGAYENPLGIPIGPILVPEQYASIQAGIDAASDGDVVLVRDNTYYENINFKGKAITVASYFLMDGDTTHVNNTIIDGSQPSHADSGSVVFFISGEDTTSVLCGFTITKGSGTETTTLWKGVQEQCRAGGGIFCYNSGARILNNRIISNSVSSQDDKVLGGGLAVFPLGSTACVILTGNQIKQNSLTAASRMARGGGVVLFGNGIVVNNLISFNSIVHNAPIEQASSGGLECRSDSSDRRSVIVESNKIIRNSIVSYSSNVPTALGGGVTISGILGRFVKNEVSNNEIWVKADQYGCGAGMAVFEVPNSFIVKGNFIRGNAVTQGYGYGGGININAKSVPTFSNNIIDGNSATNGGAFLIGGNSKPKLINNTVINNKATTGAGIYSGGSSNVYLMNNILWANQAPTHAAIYIESGTVQAAYCDIQDGWSGTENINADPLFVDDSFQLSDKSPCIGKGIASFDFGGGLICYCPETDIAGNSRPDPVGSNPDIGAYESPLGPDKVMDLPLTEIPKTYFLAQNYPNPFNPSTTIEFALPKSAFVTLKVYNLLGEEVATLVAEQRSAGIHKLNWDARGLASGVYFYRLEAGDFVQVKKLILMR